MKKRDSNRIVSDHKAKPFSGRTLNYDHYNTYERKLSFQAKESQDRVIVLDRELTKYQQKYKDSLQEVNEYTWTHNELLFEMNHFQRSKF